METNIHVISFRIKGSYTTDLSANHIISRNKNLQQINYPSSSYIVPQSVESLTANLITPAGPSRGLILNQRIFFPASCPPSSDG